MKENDGLKYLLVAGTSIAFFATAVPILEAFGTFVSNMFGLQSVKLNAKANEIAETNVG